MPLVRQVYNCHILTEVVSCRKVRSVSWGDKFLALGVSRQILAIYVWQPTVAAEGTAGLSDTLIIGAHSLRSGWSLPEGAAE